MSNSNAPSQMPEDFQQLIQNTLDTEKSRKRGDFQTLQLAIHGWTQIFSHPSFLVPDHPEFLIYYAIDLYTRFLQLGSITDLNTAIELYQEALRFVTPEAAPLDYAMTQNNLGAAYGDLPTGDRGENLSRAIACYQEALRFVTPEADPYKCIQTGSNLGKVEYQIGQYVEVIIALEKVHQAIQFVRGWTPNQTEQAELAQKNADVYSHLVHSCLITGEEEKALLYAEAGKSRGLVDALRSIRLDLENTASTDPTLNKKWGQIKEIRKQLDGILSRLDQEGGQRNLEMDREAMSIQIRDLFKEESRLWEELEKDYPLFTLTQTAAEISVEKAQSLARDENATLISYYQHAGGWCAFVIAPEKLSVIELPEVNDIFLNWCHSELNRMGKDLGIKASWSLYPALYQKLFAPLEPQLPPEGSRLVILPYGRLHLLPFSAALKAPEGLYLNQRFRVRIVPSLSTLAAMRDAAAKHQPEETELNEMLAVAFPGDTTSPSYLRFVENEARYVQSSFARSEYLDPKRATPREVIRHARQSAAVHLSCHGWFNPLQPKESGLLLKNGWLTVQQVIAEMHLEQTYLVVLAACQSGKADIRGGDELTGLTQAFSIAGARSVVGTLWSINDQTTNLLMAHFYQQIRMGDPLDEALRKAQMALQSQPETRHPFYWAAFFVHGLGINEYAGERQYPVENTVFERSFDHAPLAALERERGGEEMNAQYFLKWMETSLIRMAGLLDSQLLPASVKDLLEQSMPDFLNRLSEASQSQDSRLALETSMQFLKWLNSNKELREWFIGQEDMSLTNSNRNWNIDAIDPDQTWDNQGLGQIIPKILNQMVIIKQFFKEEPDKKEEDDSEQSS